MRHYAGSGSQSLENTREGALEQEGIDNDDVTHGTSKTTSEDTVVQNLIDAIEEQDGVEIETYTYDAETGEFEYTIKVTISDLAPASGSGSAKASLTPLDVVVPLFRGVRGRIRCRLRFGMTGSTFFGLVIWRFAI